MNRLVLFLFTVTLTLMFAVSLFSQEKTKVRSDNDMQDCPMHAEHAKHAADADRAAGVDARGDQAMGFSHEATSHYFRVTDDGGTIEAFVKDPTDTASLTQIRNHMKNISRMFSEGNFDVPLFIHGEVPSGVPAMKKLGSQIEYRYEEAENGARVRIITANPDGVKSIHDFMRFQVSEHRTGDNTHEHSNSHKH